ncbi:MAG: YggT family protein [Acidimicrobiales bacterium]
MTALVCQFLSVYVIILIARAILSFFPLSPGSIMATVFGVVYSVTEPVLAPLRRIIPPLGMFDLSFLVLIFGIRFLQAGLGCGLF